MLFGWLEHFGGYDDIVGWELVDGIFVRRSVVGVK